MEHRGSPETPSGTIPRGRLGTSSRAWALPASEQSEPSSAGGEPVEADRQTPQLSVCALQATPSGKGPGSSTESRKRRPVIEEVQSVPFRKGSEREGSSQGQGQSLRPVYELEERMLAHPDSSSLVFPTISHSETNLLPLRRATQENRIKLTYLERPIPATK